MSWLATAPDKILLIGQYAINIPSKHKKKACRFSTACKMVLRQHGLSDLEREDLMVHAGVTPFCMQSRSKKKEYTKIR